MAKKEKEVKENNKNRNFLKEIKLELKKVTWPTPRELFNNTVTVISFVLIIAFFVFVFDFCFDNLNKYGITKIQEKIQTSLKPQNENSEDVKEEETTDSEDTENLETITSEENNEENSENKEQE